MPASTTLLQFLIMLVAGWLQRQQTAMVEYMKAENCLLSRATWRTAHRLPRRRAQAATREGEGGAAQGATRAWPCARGKPWATPIKAGFIAIAGAILIQQLGASSLNDST